MSRQTALLIDIAVTVAAFALIAIVAAILPGERGLLKSVWCLALLAVGGLCLTSGFGLSIYLLISELTRSRSSPTGKIVAMGTPQAAPNINPSVSLRRLLAFVGLGILSGATAMALVGPREGELRFDHSEFSGTFLVAHGAICGAWIGLIVGCTRSPQSANWRLRYVLTAFGSAMVSVIGLWVYYLAEGYLRLLTGDF